MHLSLVENNPKTLNSTEELTDHQTMTQLNISQRSSALFLGAAQLVGAVA